MFKKTASVLNGIINAGLLSIKTSFSSSHLLPILILNYFFLGVVSLFDKTLSVGMMVIVFLTVITIFVLKRVGFRTRAIYVLFLIVLFVHLASSLFVYYAHFQPFSGGAGDFSTYNSLGQEISERISHGNFSLQGIDFENHYAVVVGYIYALLIPEILIGQMLNAWVVALLAIFVFLIVLEAGGSEKQGFLAGLIINFYPSLFFYGSLLGKDALVALYSTIALFLILKLIKISSIKQLLVNFLFFYIIMSALMNVRIYIGFAIVFTFIVCWFLFSNLKIKKRLVYGTMIILFLGFLPFVSGGSSAGGGYYGFNFFKAFLNKKTITYYRELIAIPNPKISPITGYPVYDEPSVPEAPVVEQSPVVEEPPAVEETSVVEDKPVTKRGRGSAVMVKTGFENIFTFLKNSLISFVYASIGPFPWQLRYLRHLFILPEIILLYFSLFFIIKGIKKPLKSHAFTLLFFSLILLGGLSIFIANFGITTRIRIPAFVSLFCLAPFGINWASNNKIIKILSKSLDALIK